MPVVAPGGNRDVVPTTFLQVGPGLSTKSNDKIFEGLMGVVMGLNVLITPYSSYLLRTGAATDKLLVYKIKGNCKILTQFPELSKEALSWQVY